MSRALDELAALQVAHLSRCGPRGRPYVSMEPALLNRTIRDMNMMMVALRDVEHGDPDPRGRAARAIDALRRTE